MEQIMVKYWRTWRSGGGELMNYFIAGATNYDTEYGTWGLTDDLTKTEIGLAMLTGLIMPAPSVQATETNFSNINNYTPEVTFPASMLTYALSQNDQNTRPLDNKNNLDTFASNEFNRIGEALGIPKTELQQSRIANHGTFCLMMSDKWLYRIDVSGNQTFKPVSNIPSTTLSIESGQIKANAQPSVGRLENVARNVLNLLGYKNTANLSKITVKNEILFIGKKHTSQYQTYAGRQLIRLSTSDNNTYFQVVTDKNNTPIRIDTNLSSNETLKAARLLQEALQNAKTVGTSLVETTSAFHIGTFFDPSEYRFGINAHSYDGKDFLDPRALGNPFTRQTSAFQLSGLYEQASIGAYLRTSESNFWNYYWWDRYGRVGGMLGNWDPRSKQWQKAQVSISHHSLSEYQISSSGPLKRNLITLADGSQKEFPLITNGKLDANFNKDLANCTIATFSTHGGPINGIFQLRKGLDMWFSPNMGYELGTGNLRHIIFNGCGAFGCFKQSNNNQSDLSLLTQWLPAKNVLGLSTVSGYDGEFIGLDRDGPRFTGYYNKGDSINDAHRNAAIDECSDNAPVTVGYGETTEQALFNTVDARISPAKSNTAYSAASVWRSMQ
jgi:hypothetical protein